MPPKRNMPGTVDGYLADASGNAITTGTTTVLFKGSTGGATTGAWSAGTGTVLYKATGGSWEYSYPAGEVNYDHTAFMFTNAAAVSYLVNVYPTSVEAAFDGTGGVGLTLNRITVIGEYQYEGCVIIQNTAEEGKGIYVEALAPEGVAFDLLAYKQGIRSSSTHDAGITAQSEIYYGLECMCGADYTKGIAGDLHGNVYGRVRGWPVHDVTGFYGVGVLANSNGNAALATAAALSALTTIATAITNKLGSFAASGANTVLGFLRALFRKDASAPSDAGGTFDPAKHSVEAIRDAMMLAASYTAPPSASSIASQVEVVLSASHGDGAWEATTVNINTTETSVETND